MTRSLLLLLVVYSIAFGACGEKEWERFSSKQDDFAILFPGRPTEGKKTARIGNESIEVYIVGFEDASSYYGVVCTEYPASQIPRTRNGVERIIEAVITGTIKEMHGRLTSRREVWLDGHPGREVTFETPEGEAMPKGTGRIRAYMVRNRMYQVMTLTNQDLTNADHGRFLDSFELVSK